MKKLMMSFIVVLAFSLTGCVQTLNVTTEQSDVLAEYIADLILKYDKNYSEKLVSIDPKESDTDISQPKEEPISNEETANDTNGDEKIDNNSNPQDQVLVQKPNNKEIEEVMGLKYFDVKYSKYGLYDSFPKDIKDLVLEARTGKKLLVVELKIKNKSTTSKRFELMSKGISYELNINSKDMYRPILTLLPNDMQYIDIAVDGGKTEIGYLVFEIPQNSRVQNADIVVTNKDAIATILLK